MIAHKCRRGLHFQDDLVCAACDQQERCAFYHDIYAEREEELIQKMKNYVESHEKYTLEVYLMATKKNKRGRKNKYIVVNNDMEIIGLGTKAQIKKQKKLEGHKVMRITTVYKPVYRVTLSSSSFDSSSSKSGTTLSERKNNTKYGVVKKKKIIEITTYNGIVKELKKGKKFKGCKFIKINAVQEVKASISLKKVNLTQKDVK